MESKYNEKALIVLSKIIYPETNTKWLETVKDGLSIPAQTAIDAMCQLAEEIEKEIINNIKKTHFSVDEIEKLIKII